MKACRLIPAADQRAGAHYRRRAVGKRAALSAEKLPTRFFSRRPGRCRTCSRRCSGAAAWTETEMFRTFNMGLGMVLAVSREKAAAVRKLLAPVSRSRPGREGQPGSSGLCSRGSVPSFVYGSGEGAGERKPENLFLVRSPSPVVRKNSSRFAGPAKIMTEGLPWVLCAKVGIGVLVSGGGSNFQACGRRIRRGDSRAPRCGWWSPTSPASGPWSGPRSSGVEALVWSRRIFPTRAAYFARVGEEFKKRDVRWCAWRGSC